MTIQCFCVDDEPLARQGLTLALSGATDFSLIGSFGSVDEALASQSLAPDVVFLDIAMPRKDGFSLIEAWKEKLPYVVFVTAYEEYALKAFEHDALDYLLKPIDENQFERVLDKIRKALGNDQGHSKSDLQKRIAKLERRLNSHHFQLTLKTDEGYFRVKAEDIYSLEAVSDHVCYHLKSKQLLVRTTLKKSLAELSDLNFLQVHRSHVINKNKVVTVSKANFGDHLLLLDNGQEIRMSRRFKFGFFSDNS